MTDKTCAERIDVSFESTMDDLRKLWSAYCGEECPRCEGIGETKKSPKSKAKNPVIITCPLCKGEGNLTDDSYSEEIGVLNEYGLCFDYCAPDEKRPGYFRYQLSWGGPSDEFRIFAEKVNDYKFFVYKIEYWFLDWFDGAHKLLQSDDLKLIVEIFTQYFVDSGTANFVYENTMGDWEDLEEEEND